MEAVHDIYIDKSNRIQNIQVLWEIQFVDLEGEQLPQYSKYFRLKNISTNLFLAVRKQSSRYELALTYEGWQRECIFKFYAKNSIVQECDQIHFQDVVQIKSALRLSLKGKKGTLGSQKIELILNANKKGEERTADSPCLNVIRRDGLNKHQMSMTLFTIGIISSEIKEIVDKLSSMKQQLLEFNIFLQNWGIKQYASSFYYCLDMAQQHKKDLEEEIEDLNECLSNVLQYYLNDDAGDGDKPETLKKVSYQQKQKILYDNDIPQTIIMVLQQIAFFIYGNVSQSNNCAYHVPLKSPQEIALKLMKEIIHDLYDCLLKIVEKNHYCATQLMEQSTVEFEAALDQLQQNVIKENKLNLLDYLVNQIKDPLQKDKTQELITEIITYIDRKQVIKIIGIWINRLEPIHQYNVQEQYFFLKILCLVLCDSTESPIYENQIECMKYIQANSEDPDDIIQGQELNSCLPAFEYAADQQQFRV